MRTKSCGTIFEEKTLKIKMRKWEICEQHDSRSRIAIAEVLNAVCWYPLLEENNNNHWNASWTLGKVTKKARTYLSMTSWRSLATKVSVKYCSNKSFLPKAMMATSNSTNEYDVITYIVYLRKETIQTKTNQSIPGLNII